MNYRLPAEQFLRPIFVESLLIREMERQPHLRDHTRRAIVDSMNPEVIKVEYKTVGLAGPTQFIQHPRQKEQINLIKAEAHGQLKIWDASIVPDLTKVSKQLAALLMRAQLEQDIFALKAAVVNPWAMHAAVLWEGLQAFIGNREPAPTTVLLLSAETRLEIEAETSAHDAEREVWQGFHLIETPLIPRDQVIGFGWRDHEYPLQQFEFVDPGLTSSGIVHRRIEKKDGIATIEAWTNTYTRYIGVPDQVFTITISHGRQEQVGH